MRHQKFWAGIAIALVLMLAPNASGQTPGQFEVRFDVSGLTADQQTALAPSLSASKSFWDAAITGYQPGITLNGIDIEVFVEAIDGPLNTLAFAGPNGFISTQGLNTPETDFTFATDRFATESQGEITIDSADFNTSLIIDVINHEVGHAIGFGTLFDVGVNDLAPVDGEYAGPEGLAAYQAEFDATALFIPLQNEVVDGEPVINGHLEETNNITDALGRSASDELFTPIIEFATNASDPSSNFLSETSLGIFRDLGYTTAVAVPEPSTLALLAFGGVALCGRRRRLAL